MKSLFILASIGVLVGFLIAASGPVSAQCTGQECQTQHSASSNEPDNTYDGCCKSGTPQGSEPPYPQQGTNCNGGYYYEANWTYSRSGITHDSQNCTNTDDACTRVPPDYQICAQPIIAVVSKKKHYRIDGLGNPMYDHTWTTDTLIQCNCGRHGCNQ